MVFGVRETSPERTSEGEGEKPKPKERYIPPEPSNDESVMFGSGISCGINFDKFDSISVKVSGDNPVRPISTFDRCGFRPIVAENLLKSGYRKPTPVQKYAFPIILNGRDLMACAQTGSGKTAAYLVPIIHILLAEQYELIVNSSNVEPQVLVLAPTRELAVQIYLEARKFAHGSIIKTCVLYGGTATFRQLGNLMRGCHVLVGTPGRVNDFVDREKLGFSSLRFLVLDEADRMLDMGFLPSVKKMLQHPTMTPVGQRQTLLFSATYPKEIQKLASDYMHNYLFLAVGIVGGASSDVEQIIHKVSKFEKKEKLTSILREKVDDKQLTLVFVEQKRTADFIAAYLSENGIPTTSIHGDRLQSQREQALLDFKTGYKPTLVATAVAARGLDIKNVSHVINYDLPSTIEEYVHRIGRTGRVGNRGKATSFYDPDIDFSLSADLLKVLEDSNQTLPLFLAGSKPYGSGGFERKENGFIGKDFRNSVSITSKVYSNHEEEEEW
ncbi:ATP-dependent RNA helicase vasa-like [Cimex lectularius]|uniref:RNA helicase n=1 Tax=Cimex lectularius TaxID=79782 RepID=A0A8I6S4R8_CIMLE|nr:ATP-dependent RNA helicase vasa-like [Cimex lectularius]